MHERKRKKQLYILHGCVSSKINLWILYNLPFLICIKIHCQMETSTLYFNDNNLERNLNLA